MVTSTKRSSLDHQVVNAIRLNVTEAKAFVQPLRGVEMLHVNGHPAIRCFPFRQHVAQESRADSTAAMFGHQADVHDADFLRRSMKQEASDRAAVLFDDQKLAVAVM